MLKLILINIFLITGLFASDVVNLNDVTKVKNSSKIEERTTKTRTKPIKRIQNDNKERIELPKKVSKEKE
ncbi:hypothetical protein [Aliarcobacter butzleri]|uniref:hypothetical protein n=1 Tax=Aliarcobacter butzleri TaxID=28197 RepID=UPI0021B3F716|nr:hypothetical protein [Aliarcobacter butzleri]MCT7577158.1 hypothetical protein [Aliarcobacter butzleri]